MKVVEGPQGRVQPFDMSLQPIHDAAFADIRYRGRISQRIVMVVYHCL